MAMLSELKTGAKAFIENINAGLDARKRLMELGLLPGTQIEIVARHPLGGPVLLKVGRSHVALGRGVARNIEVSSP